MNRKVGQVSEGIGMDIWESWTVEIRLWIIIFVALSTFSCAVMIIERCVERKSVISEKLKNVSRGALITVCAVPGAMLITVMYGSIGAIAGMFLVNKIADFFLYEDLKVLLVPPQSAGSIREKS
jgi:hypothetical protein